MKRFAALLCLLAAQPVFAQSVTLPETVQGLPGQWIIIAPLKVDGGAVKFRFDPALQEVHLDLLFPGQAPKGRVVSATAPGRYKIEAWNAKGDVASDISVGWVVILGTPAPPVPPDPPPIPPKPPAPVPSPSPFPLAGFRALVIFEQVGGTAVLSKTQYNELYGQEVADYLDAKCAKGSQGKPEWRIWNKTTPLQNAPKIWQDAMQRPRGKLPWIIMGDGTSGFEGELPDGGGILPLLKKWGG